MAYEADRVVVEIIAEVDQFNQPVKQSATAFDQSMNKIVSSAKKGEAATGPLTVGAKEFAAALKAAGNDLNKVSLGAGAAGKHFVQAEVGVSKFTKSAVLASSRSQILGSQIGNIAAQLASGGNPFLTLARQGPQVANAMRMVSLGTGVLAGVLGGIFITSALAAAGALFKLAFQSDDTAGKVDDLVQKLKENAENTHLAREASDIFANTLEGVTKALDDNEAALEKLNEQDKTAARQALENAIAARARLEAIQAETQANIDLARTRLAVAQATAGGSDAGLDFIVKFSKQLDALEARFKASAAGISRANSQIQDALSRRVVEMAQEQSDPVKRINKLYDAQVESARRLAVANKTVTSELNKQVAAIEAQRRAALKAEQDRKRADNSNRQSGRQINESDARAIVAGIGGSVTSGTRSAQHNQNVGGVAGSFHVKGQALDIAKTAGMTLGKIVKAFEAAGVNLIERLDEGDHFHVAWSKRGKQGPSAETLARRAQAAADAAERREQAYQNELASMQSDELDARQALITSAEEIATLEKQAIEVARAKYEDNVKSLVEQRKLTAAESAELIKINDERAKLRTELVNRREAERKFRMQEQALQNAAELAGAQLQNQADILQGQAQLATTQRERRDIEHRLLDLQFQEERIRLEAIIAHSERLKLNKQALESERIEAEAAAAIARIRLESIDQRQANAVAVSDRGNQSPLQSYFGDIQAQADDMNSAFESIAAGGLATFTDALTDAIVNFTSLGDVGRAVLQNLTAALVKMAIQQLILATIGKAMGAGATAATSAQAAAAAAAWAPAAAAASLATLGANAGPAAAALAGTHALSMALSSAGGGGLAEGGRVYGPGTETSDSVPARLSTNEFVIRARSARSIGFSALEHMNRTGQFPGFSSGGRVRSISPMNVPAASMNGGGGGFSPSDIATLRGIVSEAIHAMPAVSLYASFDPGDSMERGFATKAGEKALFAALGRNSGKVKATLG